MAGAHREFTGGCQEFADRWSGAYWEFVGGLLGVRWEFADRRLGARWGFAGRMSRVHQEFVERLIDVSDNEDCVLGDQPRPSHLQGWSAAARALAKAVAYKGDCPWLG
ncbi:hypothetical protein B296_00049277 [Ensete ventricosum]|uniref:Uncharacterized protein n=1 Tax=Ensete ventricosum TaxID=4639 RepID=A0A426X0K1_ENSVE|nr:hypothetical protein B296_00049277 [Ensete ventricosum]